MHGCVGVRASADLVSHDRQAKLVRAALVDGLGAMKKHHPGELVLFTLDSAALRRNFGIAWIGKTPTSSMPAASSLTLFEAIQTVADPHQNPHAYPLTLTLTLTLTPSPTFTLTHAQVL